MHSLIRRYLWRPLWRLRWHFFHRLRFSPLDRALCQAVVTQNLQNVEVLLARGGNANFRFTYDQPLLLLAVVHSNSSIVRLLIEAGAEVNASHPLYGLTALMRACTTGDANMVRLLLEQGADLNAVDHAGRTPLYWAIRAENSDLVTLLLDAGADIHHSGDSAIKLAKRKKSVPVIEALRRAGAIK